jgi:hypothetical protein
MSCIQIITIIILIYIIYINNTCSKEGFFNKDLSHSRVQASDKKKYEVIEQYNNNKEAADKLAYLNEYIIELLRHMRKKYIWERIGMPETQVIVERILNNYNPDRLFENIPEGIHDTSYIEDKGTRFAMCLRKKNINKGEIHDNSILQFVLLHELAHIGSIEYGHNDEFWHTFKFLLTEAASIGMYIPINYAKYPENYCGLDVTYNPYYG